MADVAEHRYHVGVDGISSLRPAFDLPDADLHPGQLGRHSDTGKEYMIAFLRLETMMVGMFCALDFVLFYIFFEGVLIPMFLIIGFGADAPGLCGVQVLPLHAARLRPDAAGIIAMYVQVGRRYPDPDGFRV